MTNDVPEFGQPDSRTADERDEDRARADHQLATAAERWGSRHRRFHDLELLVGRRNQNPDRADEPLEIIETEDGREVLVQRHEILTTRSDLDDDEFRGLLESLGWREASPRSREECLDLVRWIWTGSEDAGTWDELSRLRCRTGRRATPTYVLPFGAVMKGGTTPEETSETRPTRPGRGDDMSVAVAVIDTGLAFQDRTDGWLNDLENFSEKDPLDVIPDPPPHQFLDAGAGHGSFVAGVVQQIVPDAQIHVYQVLDTDGLANELQVACAMIRAVDKQLDEGGRLILNLSLGTDTVDDEPLLALEAALDRIDDIQAERRGEVLVVAAAGNSGTAHPHWPAAFDRVVGVGALDLDESPADFSTRGAWVDCSTVGVGIRSTYVMGEELPDLDAPEPHETWGSDSWAQWLGTSFAAPQVTGAVAKLAEESGSSLRLSLQTLLRGAPRLPGFGRKVRILR